MRIAVAVVVGLVLWGVGPWVRADECHEIDGCRAADQSCQNASKSIRGISCTADDLRCEKACPKPEPEGAAAPPAKLPSECGQASVTAPAPVPGRAVPADPAPEVKSQPRLAARVEGAAAPAPASATSAATVGERAGTTAPTVRSEAVTPPAEVVAEPSTVAVRPVQSERGFFGKLVCFFRSCDPAGSTP